MGPATELRPPAGTAAQRVRSRVGFATALTTTLMLATAPAALADDSLSVSSSSGAQATVPMTISAQGETSATSALRVFVEAGSGPCAVSADVEAGRSAVTEVITQSPAGAFSYSAAYTPPAPGDYEVCAYAYRSSPESTVSSDVSHSFAVADAPSPPPASTPAPAPTTSPSTSKPAKATKQKRCVVPKLTGRTYASARTLIHRAGCIVGQVSKPSHSKSAPLHKGGRRRVLTVSHQITKAGKVLKARGRVSLALKYVTPKAPGKH